MGHGRYIQSILKSIETNIHQLVTEGNDAKASGQLQVFANNTYIYVDI